MPNDASCRTTEARREIRPPHPMDVHIGKRLRLRRRLDGRSLQELARQMGLAFQQIQKYETAVNRVSTSHLVALAEALNCPVTFFYEGMAKAPQRFESRERDQALPSFPRTFDALASQETIRLARAYTAIRSPKTRRRLLALVLSVGTSPGCLDCDDMDAPDLFAHAGAAGPADQEGTS